MRTAAGILCAILSISLAWADEPATIGVGDVLRLDVLGFEEYSGELTVASDGWISGAGFGHLAVAGQSLEQAEGKIRERLLGLLTDPRVFLSFKSQASAVIYVVGAAVSNGSVPYTPGTDLRRLFAGTEIEDPGQFLATVYRSGKPIRTVEMAALLEGSDVWVGPLEPQDVVIVATKPTIRIWLVGQFTNPGEMSVPAGSSLAQAVAFAGGLAPPIGVSSSASQETLLDQMEIVVRRGGEQFGFSARFGIIAHSFRIQAGDTISALPPQRIEVFVAGQVQSPGKLTLGSGSDVMAAVTTAGGLLSDGTLDGVLVFRNGETVRLDLSARLDGEGRYDKFALMPGDIVFVPDNRRYVYVLGEVERPGRYAIRDNERLTAADALSLAGGVNAEGTTRRVALVRVGPDGKYVVQTFHIDEFLKDGIEGANPAMLPGDFLYFGEPKGITIDSITKLASAALLFDVFLGGR
ncbi:MAG: SLBB domain-containing protein [Armatimonadetes bacterium]|nr:SLBB domain-containing protein [Armatimonadota bacterium]